MEHAVPQPAPGAPLAGGDPTRRWGIGTAGSVGFPGLTRPEADAAAPVLAGRAPGAHLVAVTLPVLLTDGAGPHLVDEAGTLVLALGPHPAVPEAKVAMGPAAGGVVVGLVRPVGGPVWAWLVRAEVAEAERTRALDVLDALPGEEALAAWPHDPLGPAGWRSLTGDADGGDR